MPFFFSPCSKGKHSPHGSHFRGTNRQNESLITLCRGPCNWKRVEHFLIMSTHRHTFTFCAFCSRACPISQRLACAVEATWDVDYCRLADAVFLHSGFQSRLVSWVHTMGTGQRRMCGETLNKIKESTNLPHVWHMLEVSLIVSTERMWLSM